MKKLSIIIPVFNESRTIRELLRRVDDASLSDWDKEIIVVDDGSTDGTRDILREYEQRVRVIYVSKNSGKGAAVRRGLEEAHGNYALIQDADLEYDPSEIEALLGPIERRKADVVYGSRNLYHKKRSGFIIPRIGAWLVTKQLNFLYGIRLTDVWTCYKLFPMEAAPDFVSGGFESELLFTASLARRGYKFAEVPISHDPRGVNEGKKIRYRDGFYSIAVLILDRLLHLRSPDNQKVRDMKNFVACPVCKNSISYLQNKYVCRGDGEFPIDASGRPYLIDQKIYRSQQKDHKSGVNWLKSFLKQFPRIYYGIWNFFCPVLMVVNGPKKIRKFFEKDTVIFNIGSGPERLGKEFINIDVFPFPEVDIVADAAHLPFADESVSALVSESLLEHVSDPHGVASEMMRVIKPGGILYASAPFIHPYHASPDDFNRWTISGLKYLFHDLEIIESGVRSGPWSAILMFLAYWFGVIFSLGSQKSAPFLAHIFMLVLGPLKYLDLLFMKLPGSHAVAAHVYVIAKKN